MRNILRDVVFWALVALLIAFGINNGYFAGRVAERNVWPVTYLMVQAVEGSAMLFLLIVAGLYAAELLWSERDTHFDGIHDALPMRESTDWLSRLTAVVVVELILLAFAMLVGIFMQTIAGYHHYEFGSIFQGTLRGDLPAGPHLYSFRFLRPNPGLEQVYRPRHCDRRLRVCCRFFLLSAGKTLCISSARCPLTPTPT